MKKLSTPMRLATRTECAKNPRGVLERAKQEGPLVITDAKGRARGVLCVSTETLPFDLVD
jgi:hypothetical protein